MSLNQSFISDSRLSLTTKICCCDEFNVPLTTKSWRQLFIVSSERLKERRMEPTIICLQGQHAIKPLCHSRDLYCHILAFVVTVFSNDMPVMCNAELIYSK